MGKRSKNKNKNTRAVHHGRVKNTEKIFDNLLVGISGENGQERKALELLQRNLSLLQESKLSYFVLKKQGVFTKRLLEVHMHLLSNHLHSQNYTDAFESFNIVMEQAETSYQRKVLEPFQDLFLLRIKKENKDKIAESLVRKTEKIIVGGEAKHSWNVAFLPRVLLELSRLQMFEAVHYLSCLILEKMSLGNNVQNIIGRKF